MVYRFYIFAEEEDTMFQFAQGNLLKAGTFLHHSSKHGSLGQEQGRKNRHCLQEVGGSGFSLPACLALHVPACFPPSLPYHDFYTPSTCLQHYL